MDCNRGALSSSGGRYFALPCSEQYEGTCIRLCVLIFPSGRRDLHGLKVLHDASIPDRCAEFSFVDSVRCRQG